MSIVESCVCVLSVVVILLSHIPDFVFSLMIHRSLRAYFFFLQPCTYASCTILAVIGCHVNFLSDPPRSFFILLPASLLFLCCFLILFAVFFVLWYFLLCAFLQCVFTSNFLACVLCSSYLIFLLVIFLVLFVCLFVIVFLDQEPGSIFPRHFPVVMGFFFICVILCFVMWLHFCVLDCSLFLYLFVVISLGV